MRKTLLTALLIITCLAAYAGGGPEETIDINGFHWTGTTASLLQIGAIAIGAITIACITVRRKLVSQAIGCISLYIIAVVMIIKGSLSHDYQMPVSMLIVWCVVFAITCLILATRRKHDNQDDQNSVWRYLLQEMHDAVNIELLMQ